jgi:prolyl 4-hydroxylase
VRLLSDYVKVYDGVVSSEQCQAIIDIAEAKGFQLYDNETYKFYQFNLNENGMIDTAQSFAELLVPIAEHYFKSVGVDRYIGVQGFEQVRIKKYPKNSDFQFKTHIDVSDKANAVRYLVFILYLNDNNGNTTFEQLDLSVKPQQGSVVVFPPYWLFPHAGTIPTDNDKYIMMTSLHHV